MQKKKREDYVLEIINRWGRLNARQIQSMAVTAMGESGTQAYPIKTLYAHLKKLEEDDVIDVEHYSAQGELISLERLDEVKNPRKLYVRKAPIENISGAEILQELGGDIFCPKHILPFFNIFDGLSDIPSENEIHLYFNINQEFLNFRLDTDVFDCNLLIGRSVSEDREQTLNCLGEFFTRRTLLLELPSPKISSYKRDTYSGHCLITFNNENAVTIKDLGSTNGTKVKIISNKDALALQKKGELFGNKTLTSNWSNIPSLKELTLAPKKEQSFDLPFILELGGEFNLLFIHSKILSP
ncbi:MAG: hypothetical protein OHK0056_25030 [Bacteriovoracaceae bacterium]